MKKFGLPLILIFVIIAGLISYVYISKNQNANKKTSENKNYGVSMTFKEKNITTSLNGSNLVVNITISPKDYKITGAKIALKYDPQILQLVTISANQDYFNQEKVAEIQKNINNSLGKAIYNFYVMPQNAGFGDGDFVTAIFKPVKSGQTTISFINSSTSPMQVTALNQFVNLLSENSAIGELSVAINK